PLFANEKNVGVSGIRDRDPKRLTGSGIFRTGRVEGHPSWQPKVSKIKSVVQEVWESGHCLALDNFLPDLRCRGFAPSGPHLKTRGSVVQAEGARLRQDGANGEHNILFQPIVRIDVSD